MDAYNVPQADSGDITGTDSRLTSVMSVNPQAVTVGNPYSLQVAAETTSSGKALAYTAAGLPDGLAIDPAAGLISGTPTKYAGSDNAKITATGFGRPTGTTTINFTGKPAARPPGRPAAQITIPHGKGASLSPTRKNVTWQQTKPSWVKMVITGQRPRPRGQRPRPDVFTPGRNARETRSGPM